MTMFFDGRDSAAHSIIGTPPQSDTSMTDMSLARRGSGGGHLAAQDLLLFSHDGSRSSPAAQRALFAARHSGDYQKLVRKMKARAKLRRMSCKVRPAVSNQLFENSDTSLNMSVDDGVNGSGFGNDHSGLSLSSIPVSTVTARGGATSSRRRLSMAFCALDDSFDGHSHKRMANIAEEHSTLDEDDAMHSHSYLATDPFLSSRQITDLAAMEKTLRRGVVVGGRFLHEWDNNTPVVVAPEGNEHRVDDARLGESMELSLHIDVPGDMAGQWVELGADWHWAHCNPLGYLVFCAPPANRRAKVTVYYLPKHPAQWNVFAAATAANQSQQSMLLDQSGMQDVSMIEGNNDNCFVMDGVEDALFHTSSPVSYAQAPRYFFPATSSSSSSASLQHLPPWAVSHVFSFLRDEDIYASCLTLNKFWSLLAQVHCIPKRSDQLRRDAPDTCWERFKRFVVDCPRGKFLSDGAFKRVYAVRSAVHGRQDALSIMDVKDLEAREIEGVAKVEMEISLMCSLLATMKICPNMIKVHAMFQAEHDVTVWRPWAVESMADLQSLPSVDAKTVYKKTFAAKKGRYQYCQMEFCTGGDVEELVRKAKVLGLEEVRSFLFQMFFAMYAARESLALRHYDIKLLNFFATNDVDSSLLPSSSSPAVTGSTTSPDAVPSSAPQMVVGFGKHLFRIDGAASHRPGIVKMADFGTSTVGSETLGTPITVQQFTTLENTPMEFLLLGGSARQSYASDTFGLGLSFLHLLTGFEPYEVLLADVRCPGVLKERLNEIWDEKQPGNPYHVIFMTIQSLQAPDDPELSTLSQDDTIQDILCDTLYRFFVLLGNSPYLESGFVRNPLYVQNPVWKALVDHLALEEKFTAPPVAHSGSLGSLFPALPTTRAAASHFGHNAQKQQSRLTKQQTLEQHCRETYRRDVRLYSIHTGEHQHLERLRQRLDGLGVGAMDLLDRLLHFDPTQRCTMYDALHHPVFESLRIPVDGSGGSSSGDVSSLSLPPQTQRYLYYYNRRGHTSVDDGLPLL
jgi:serine/threonine protein kinase